jgi:hypothetical protein
MKENCTDKQSYSILDIIFKKSTPDIKANVINPWVLPFPGSSLEMGYVKNNNITIAVQILKAFNNHSKTEFRISDGRNS